LGLNGRKYGSNAVGSCIGCLSCAEHRSKMAAGSDLAGIGVIDSKKANFRFFVDAAAMD
jgi:hypothetical protein